jgi:arsenate reductase
MPYKIYHNPRCTKSRVALQLLKDEGISPEIVNYLDTPPSKAELEKVLKALGKRPRDIIRTGENEYKDNNLANPALSDDELINFVVKFPKLLERPIIVKDGSSAVIGRPPENVNKLL